MQRKLKNIIFLLLLLTIYLPNSIKADEKYILADSDFEMIGMENDSANIYVPKNYKKQNLIINSNGIKLDAYVLIPKSKNNRAIILLHGFNKLGKDHPLYKAMAHKLAEKNYLVLSFDFRGFNKSDSPRHILNANDLDFASDAVNAITYLDSHFHNIDALYIVGHSFGGGVAISAGIQDERINKIVSISPARRTQELYFGEKPSRGLNWIKHKIKNNMHLSQEVPLKLIKPVFMPLTIDYFQHHFFYKPVLFIDGELEASEDKLFLQNYVKSIQAVEKSYITIPKAAHYFGVFANQNVVKEEVIDNLINEIDKWLSK